MKKIILQSAAVVLLSTLNPQLSTVFAQGSLTPPGAPAPTMKTLAQIEPRTPISSAPFTISSSGSYYLTTNLTVSASDAITINASSVTLDLSGFTIASTTINATGSGILLNSNSDITILNGHIRGGVTNRSDGTYSGSGFANGINVTGVPVNVAIYRVSVSGCLTSGIYLGGGDSSVVESCVVRLVGGYGIVAFTVKNSSAIDCANHAINAVEVADSRGISTGGIGIAAGNVLNCSGTGVNSHGISAGTAQNCSGMSASGNGINGSATHNCYGTSSSGYGVSATVADTCYGVSAGNGYGVNAPVAQNCYGYCNGSGYGLYSNQTASNCYGNSATGTGLYTYVASNCYGQSYGSGYGLYAAYTAVGCVGTSATGTGLFANLANSCLGFAPTALNVTYKYNMP